MTLTGVGGVGKTRLALQAAASIAGNFPDGAWLVELAALTDSAAVERVVARALDIGQQRGRSLRETFADFFADKHMLIVLDNCEHLLEASRSMVDALLRGAPHLVVIATSREALGIDGERVIMVRSLSTPDLDVAMPDNYESVELFVDRARATRDDFVLTDANRGAVIEIVRRLDGIPLAIELAAARVRSMAPVDIAARLNERFRLLTGGRKTALERHQTLRAAVLWSVDLLNDDERVVFCRLGVFSGSFDLGAVESVATELSSEAVDVVDVLVARSLVIAEEVDGRVRYRLLETLRQFAAEQLDAEGLADAVRRAHAEHYASVVGALAPRMVGPDELAATRAVLAEVDNLRAAVEWSVSAGETALALRLVAKVPFFPLLSSAAFFELAACAEPAFLLDEAPRHPLYRSGINWLSARANLAGDIPTVLRLCDEAEQAFEREGHKPSGILAFEKGFALLSLGQFDASLAAFEITMNLLRKDGEAAWLAFTLSTAAIVRSNLDIEIDYAKVVAAEAVAIARGLNSPSLMAMSLFTQAAATRADLDRALALADEALMWARLSPTRIYESMTRGFRAQLAFKRGEANALQEFLPVLRDLYRGGNRNQLPTWLWVIVPMMARSGFVDEAAELVGALESGTVAEVEVLPVFVDSTAVRLELGDEAFATARARGAARSYREVMDRVFTVIERDASDGVV